MVSFKLFSVILASIIAAVSIGSSARAFNAIDITDPYMKSCWRTQIVFLCYLIPVIITWKNSKDHYLYIIRKRYLYVIGAGVMLGLHYCFWTLSLILTSVAHSLLLVSSMPLIIIIYSLIKRSKVKNLEIIGVIIGTCGLLILSLLGENKEGSTWYGDVLAFCGSIAVWLHFSISENEIEKKPLFFLCMVQIVASITCALISVLNSVFINGVEGFSVVNQIFMYFYEFQGLYAVYLGVVVGFIGNGSLYFLLQNTSQLFISIIICFEPITGTFFAWVFGFQKVISIYTYIGGIIIIIGNMLVTIVSTLKNTDKKTEISENLTDKLI